MGEMTMKKTKREKKAEIELKNNVQCNWICSDGSGKPVEVHFLGCPYYVNYHNQRKQILKKYKIL